MLLDIVKKYCQMLNRSVKFMKFLCIVTKINKLIIYKNKNPLLQLVLWIVMQLLGLNISLILQKLI